MRRRAESRETKEEKEKLVLCGETDKARCCLV